MSVLRLLRSPTKSYETNREIPASVSERTQRIHKSGLSNSRMMRQGEQNLLDDLRLMDETGGFAEFKSESLYAYAVDWWALTPAVALNLIAIMRRGRQVPELIDAIKSGQINMSAARTLTPVINRTNKEEWLELASKASVVEIQKMVATECPKAAVKESIRYVTGERMEFKLGVSEEFRDVLKEVKDLISQDQQNAVDSEDAILIALKDYVARHSPLEKAKRARLRGEKNQKLREEANEGTAEHTLDLQAPRKWQASNIAQSTTESLDAVVQTTPTKRVRFTAATKHEIHLRDGHRCTETLASGERCTQTRWLDIHHIKEVQDGGDNSLENLRTICGTHHRQHHRRERQVVCNVTYEQTAKPPLSPRPPHEHAHADRQRDHRET